MSSDQSVTYVPGCTMPGAKGGAEPGAKLDKTHPKFCILKLFSDERCKSPCSKIYPPKKPFTGSGNGAIGGIIIIAPEYKPAAAVCRSRGAPGARKGSSQ